MSCKFAPEREIPVGVWDWPPHGYSTPTRLIVSKREEPFQTRGGADLFSGLDHATRPIHVGN